MSAPTSRARPDIESDEIKSEGVIINERSLTPIRAGPLEKISLIISACIDRDC